MRAPLLILISLLTTSAAAAEALRLPPAERPQAGKTLPLKGAGGTAKAGSCAFSPGSAGTPPFGSIASSLLGRSSPRPASISFTRMQ